MHSKFSKPNNKKSIWLGEGGGRVAGPGSAFEAGYPYHFSVTLFRFWNTYLSIYKNNILGLLSYFNFNLLGGCKYKIYNDTTENLESLP